MVEDPRSEATPWYIVGFLVWLGVMVLICSLVLA